MRTTNEKKRVAPSFIAKDPNSRHWNASKFDPNLSRYFHELSCHPMLSSDEEQQVARSLWTEEVTLWTILFSEKPIAAVLPDVLRDHLEEPEHRDPLEAALAAIGDGSDTEALTRGCQALHGIDLNRHYIKTAKHLLANLARQPRFGGAAWFHTMYARFQRQERRARAIKDRFIRANLRLVVSIAKRYDRGQMPLVDLVQEGNLGLIKAVERFDHTRGFRFNTYASWWIRHAIGRALADKGQAVRVPVHALDAQQRLGKAVDAITTRLGRKPTDEELEEETGLNVKKIRKVQKNRLAAITSLDKEVFDGDGRSFVDMLTAEDQRDPFDNALLTHWAKHLEAALSCLTPMERTIVRWRFGLTGTGDELTLKEIGDYYSLSRERIRQIQEQAIGKLRRKLAVDAA